MPWAEHADNGTWRAVWRDPAGRKRSKRGFIRKAEAVRYGGEQEARGQRGEVIPGGRSITWGEWCPTWQRLRRIEPSTAATDAGYIENHLKPRWQNVRLARITREDVQEWVNSLATESRGETKKGVVRPPLGEATVARVFRLFSGSLKHAVKHGHLYASPALLIDLPVIDNELEHFLTRPEMDAILYHLNDPWRAAAHLMVGTGMRPGELAGLHWSHVDRVNGLIYISDVYDAGRRTIKPYPKGRRKREVPILSWVAPILDDLAAPARDTCGVPHRDGSTCSSGLVVTTPNGAPIDMHNFRNRFWDPAVEAAGVGHTTFKDLRHTYASWLVQAGVDLYEVARLLGHQDTRTTQRYAHFAPGRFDRPIAALEAQAPGLGIATTEGNVTSLATWRTGRFG